MDEMFAEEEHWGKELCAKHQMSYHQCQEMLCLESRGTQNNVDIRLHNHLGLNLNRCSCYLRHSSSVR